MLAPLASHLQVSVLQATAVSLDIMMRALPGSLHPQALCAQFPSITTSKFLSLSGQELSPAGATQLFAAAASFRCITSLQLIDIDTYSDDSTTASPEDPLDNNPWISQVALAGMKPPENSTLSCSLGGGATTAARSGSAQAHMHGPPL